MNNEGSCMIEMFKKIFGKKKEQTDVPNPPGRTFNRILTGRYFGCSDVNADEDTIVDIHKPDWDEMRFTICTHGREPDILFFMQSLFLF